MNADKKTQKPVLNLILIRAHRRPFSLSYSVRAKILVCSAGSLCFPIGAETALEMQLLPYHAEAADAGAHSVVLDVQPRRPELDFRYRFTILVTSGVARGPVSRALNVMRPSCASAAKNLGPT
jgi:hypothetical protein